MKSIVFGAVFSPVETNICSFFMLRRPSVKKVKVEI